MNERRQDGFSLIEVLVSLAILAAAIIPLMAVLGRASEDAYETVLQRKMRYLSQWVVGDIEVGKLNPNDEKEELPYEEGKLVYFSELKLSEDADEYEGFFYEIEAFRDEIVAGAPDEETALEAGFTADANGGLSRPITQDTLSSRTESGGEGGLFGGLAAEGAAPPGQVKRLAVVAIRREGETADEDRVFRLMLYLPHPDEEQQSVSGEAGQPGAPGAQTPEPSGGAAGGDRIGGGAGGSDGR